MSAESPEPSDWRTVHAAFINLGKSMPRGMAVTGMAQVIGCWAASQRMPEENLATLLRALNSSYKAAKRHIDDFPDAERRYDF